MKSGIILVMFLFCFSQTTAQDWPPQPRYRSPPGYQGPGPGRDQRPPGNQVPGRDERPPGYQAPGPGRDQRPPDNPGPGRDQRSPGYQGPGRDQRHPGQDPRGGPPQGGAPPRPPNPYQRQENRPPEPQFSGNQLQGGPVGMRPGSGLPPPQAPVRNSQVEAVAMFLRTEEGQKDLAAAVDKEAGVIAHEMIEVLQEDAIRDEGMTSGGIVSATTPCINFFLILALLNHLVH